MPKPINIGRFIGVRAIVDGEKSWFSTVEAFNDAVEGSVIVDQIQANYTYYTTRYGNPSEPTTSKKFSSVDALNQWWSRYQSEQAEFKANVASMIQIKEGMCRTAKQIEASKGAPRRGGSFDGKIWRSDENSIS